MQTDYHFHQCDECEFIWAHGDDCRGSGAAHRCPLCGHYGNWAVVYPKGATADRAIKAMQGQKESA